MDPQKQLTKHMWDAAAMFALLATSLMFYYVFIPSQIRMRATLGGHTNFSSRTFPYLLMAALGICAIIGLVKAGASIVRIRRQLKQTPPASAPPAPVPLLVHLAPYITYAIILAYCLLFRTIGYIPDTLLIPPLLMFVLGCRNWILYVSTYAFGALLYVVFKILMHINLP